jgi:hypothetical protein
MRSPKHAGVGKTCLLLRYANDSFSPTFITTIGIDFKIKNIQLDGKRIKLQVCPNYVWRNRFDIPGLKRDPFLLCRAADMGYGGPRTLPNNHDLVLPRRAGHSPRVRRDR